MSNHRPSKADKLDIIERELAALSEDVAVLQSHNGHDLDAVKTRVAVLESGHNKGWKLVSIAWEALIGALLAYLLLKH